MKKVFLSFLLTLWAASTSFAGSSGKGIVHHFNLHNNANGTGFGATELFLTNTSGYDVEVKMKFIKRLNTSGAPSLLTDSSTDAFAGFINAYPSAPANYSETTPGYSVTFTHHAYETVMIWLKMPTYSTTDFGYGIIEWSSTQDSLILPLMGYGYYYEYYQGGNAFYPIIINNNQPF